MKIVIWIFNNILDLFSNTFEVESQLPEILFKIENIKNVIFEFFELKIIRNF